MSGEKREKREEGGREEGGKREGGREEGGRERRECLSLNVLVPISE